MTDALPYLLLDLAGISCPQYRDELNILSDKYNAKRKRILKGKADYDELMAQEKAEKEKEAAEEEKKVSKNKKGKKKPRRGIKKHSR